MIGPNSGGLPSSIVSWGVGGVELELIVLVIASEEEGSPERSGSTNLGIVLLDIADVDDEFFNGDVCSELYSIILR